VHADLAKRLQAAALGQRYDGGSASEDAEISGSSAGHLSPDEDAVETVASPSSSRDPDALQSWARQASHYHCCLGLALIVSAYLQQGQKKSRPQCLRDLHLVCVILQHCTPASRRHVLF